MNKSVMMIMGGALLIAIFVALIVSSKLSGHQAAETAGTEILVANRKILTGEKITKDDVRWQAWPDEAVFNGVIKKADQKDENDLAVYNTPLRRDIESGEPVTTQSIIADVKDGNFLAATIGPGMRAMAISVKPETAAGGFIAPGDYVDVILSYEPKFTSTAEPYSENAVQHRASQTILYNVKVLAVDQDAKSSSDHESKAARTVTLEVSHADTERLAIAVDIGTVSLALRRLGEKDSPKDKQPLFTSDMTTLDLIKVIGQIMEKSKTTSDTVRVYNGTSIENVPVRALDKPLTGVGH